MSAAALEARLEGAQLAAKLRAQRYRETRTQSMDERERLLQMVERERTESREALGWVTGEVAFLREQLRARTDAEQDLRLPATGEHFAVRRDPDTLTGFHSSETGSGSRSPPVT